MFRINYEKFKYDIKKIKYNLDNVPKTDIENHFKKIKFWSDSFYWIGLLTLFISPYFVFPWLFLSLGIFSKWTIIGHHVCHGGFDNIKELGYNRKVYGIKTFYRRFMDWFDWWIVEAWNIEHNHLHHYYLVR